MREGGGRDRRKGHGGGTARPWNKKMESKARRMEIDEEKEIMSR